MKIVRLAFRPQLLIIVSLLIVLLSCSKSSKEESNKRSIKRIESKGIWINPNTVQKPTVVLAGIPTTIPAGNPDVKPTNLNIKIAGIPKVIPSGTPVVCTPGSDTFSLPKIIPTTGKKVVAGIPGIVVSKDMVQKEQNSANISNLGMLQGLSSPNINCLTEDKNGNIWMGFFAGGGLSKFDGKTFTNFTTYQGLASDYVRCIIEDKSRNIWVGFYLGGGLSKFDGKTFTNFTSKQGLGSDNISSLLEDRSGNIWIGTYDGGISKYDGKSFINLTNKQGLINNKVTTILEDKSGNIWFGTDSGVSKYNGKSFINFTSKQGLVNNSVKKIIEDKAGNLWFGTSGGVSKYDGKIFTNITEQEGLADNYIFNVREDKRGNIWFATWGSGAIKYDGKRFTNFTDQRGLGSNHVSDILEDKTGNLWFATWGMGISKYVGKSFTIFTEKEGLPNNYVSYIFEERNGNLWFGNSGNGVLRYDEKSFTCFTNKEGLAGDYVSNILQDKTGNLWFGTSGGLSCYDGKSFTNFTVKEGLLSDFICSIFEDKTGNLWIGTGNGVCRYDGKFFTCFTIKQGLINNMVYHMAEDNAGNIWFTTPEGVSRYDGKSFTNFTVKEGLVSNEVASVIKDKVGNLWFGTIYGVSCYNGKSFTNFTLKEGLINRAVMSLLQDKNENIWFGTTDGLSRISKKNIEKLALSSGSTEVPLPDDLFYNYGFYDGFVGLYCRGSAVLQDSEGRIWWGTNLLTCYTPEGDVIDTTAPVVQLNKIKLFAEDIVWANLGVVISDSTGNETINKKSRDTTLANGVLLHDIQYDGISKWNHIPEHLSLPYNNNNLSFSFIGVHMQSVNHIKYQYKLEGLEDNWSSISSRTEANYGNLPAGDFTFEVRAMNQSGIWSEPYKFSFVVRPPWWKTWWAYSFYILVIGGSIWGFIQYRSVALRRQNKILEEKVKLRTKELETKSTQLQTSFDNLKETQTQLIQSEKMASLGELTAGIAHEIQNPLNFVNNFSEVSSELIDEMKVELDKGDINEAKYIADDIKQNLEKINHHGKRADAIVKGMLQHSRSSSGVKEPTDINALCDEYLRLSYHGLRAKDKSFNATMKTDFDSSIGKINIISQDIGRVILNLLTNAFYVVNEKKMMNNEGYEPTVSISTKKSGSKVEINVLDNGNGIPEKILDKIFQPFFTTKPTGQGTGLGLSLSYDIVTKGHGGELKVETKNGEGTTFKIILPIS